MNEFQSDFFRFLNFLKNKKNFAFVRFSDGEAIVCRKTTEKSEGLGEFSVLCHKPEDLFEMFESTRYVPDLSGKHPYGDGPTAEKIVDILWGAI